MSCDVRCCDLTLYDTWYQTQSEAENKMSIFSHLFRHARGCTHATIHTCAHVRAYMHIQPPMCISVYNRTHTHSYECKHTLLCHILLHVPYITLADLMILGGREAESRELLDMILNRRPLMDFSRRHLPACHTKQYITSHITRHGYIRGLTTQ